MQTKNVTFRLTLMELVIRSDLENLMPEQILRRLSLYGYSEVDLAEVIAEFEGRIAKLRGHFDDQNQGRLGLV